MQAGWWTFPKIGQEGVNIPPDVQSEMLPYLRQGETEIAMAPV